MKITVNNKVYKSMAYLNTCIREELLKNNNGNIFKSDLLKAVIDSHWNKKNKIGAGIIGFRVENRVEGIGVVAVHPDKSTTVFTPKFSKEKDKKLNDYQLLAVWAREQINYQIKTFRKNNFCGYCSVTNDEILFKNSQVDHIINFKELLNTWCLTNPDGDLSRSWKLFHQENATLRITSRDFNLSRTR